MPVAETLPWKIEEIMMAVPEIKPTKMADISEIEPLSTLWYIRSPFDVN